MINLEPIGFFHTDFNSKTAVPRQGRLMPESKGIIILNKKYTKALRDLDKFEYIYVIFYFHKITDWESIVTTRHNKNRYGLFATRTPRRPNPIGMTLVKLEAIKENKLYVSGVDTFDQTPVLDIKPFLPDLDFVETEKNRNAGYHLGLRNTKS
jgi:tRNA-Thr(GGU) m(6)t(6)A37 methyltransferase TsaA